MLKQKPDDTDAQTSSTNLPQSKGMKQPEPGQRKFARMDANQWEKREKEAK